MKNGSFVALLLAVVLSWASNGYGGVEVFVSIPPQKWLVDAVGKDFVNVGVLVKEGQNPHTFEPTPRQVAALSQAKIWFIMDMEFEMQLVRKIKAVAPGLEIVDLTTGIKKIAMDESLIEHDGEEHVEEPGNEHAGEGLDPHVWLSPANLQLMARVVADTLSHADPANMAVYMGNLALVQKKLTVLDQEIRGQLKPYTGSSFYVFHPSFGYFAQSYGLVQEPVEVGGKSPSPRQLAKLIAKAKAENVKVIFVQPQFDPRSAQAVAQSIGGKVVPLDALAEDIPVNIRLMATKIEAALAQ